MRQSRFVFLIITLLCCIQCWRGNYALIEPEEARYAEIPRQMLNQDRWLIPIFDGQPYLDKPPMLFWLVQLSLKMFGIHLWAARLFPFLACLLTALVTYCWASRIHSSQAGLASALGLLMMPNYILYGSMLTINGLLGLFVTISIATGHIALQRSKISWNWWIISAACCGVAVLTKGPIALAMVIAPLLLLPWLLPPLCRPTFKAIACYGAICSGIALPWFAVVAWQEPSFVEHFFWKHHVERLFTPFDHAEPFWFYLPEFCMTTAPWLLAICVWFKYFKAESKSTLHISYLLLTSCWILLLFSIAGSKRQMYLVPLYPVLSVAVGLILCDGFFRFRMRSIVVCVIVCIGAVSWARFGVPQYYAKFTIEPVVEILSNDDRCKGLPILCYPHSWPSVGFMLNRDDIRSYSLEHRAELLSDLSRQENCLVFLKPSLKSSVHDALSNDLISTVLISNSRIVVLHISRR